MDENENTLGLKIKKIVRDSKGRYGYRRVTQTLKNNGEKVNHKRVYRIMRELEILCSKFNRKSRKYKSYKGTVGVVAENKLDQNFKVKKPNQVWVTDVSEFKVNGEKIYLSPILDLFNLEIMSFSFSNKPTTSFTNESLIKSLKKLPKEHNLWIHSDQGFHYQHESWISILKSCNVLQSMSRKGNCMDNAPIENFFGLLKQEMYYGKTFKNSGELIKEITQYIYWYNHDRIKSRLGGISPIQFKEKYFETKI